MKDKSLIILIIVLIVAIIVLFIAKNIKIDASKGGMLVGPSHAQGGIKTEIKNFGGKIEVEGNEDILTKHLNDIQDTYICQGTPSGIASALNVIAGGVSFADNGKCFKK